MGIDVGAKAPDFTLKRKTADGLQDVSLASYRGKQHVVLLFFPLVYTSVCTSEMCSVTEGLDAYTKLNAQVLAVSVDSPFAQEAWAKENKISVPVLSDFNKEVSAAYGAQYADLLGFRGVAKRAAFVVDKDGLVRYASISDDAKVLPDFGAIQKCLAAL